MFVKDRGLGALRLAGAAVLACSLSPAAVQAQGLFNRIVKKDPAVKAASADKAEAVAKDQPKREATAKLVTGQVPVSPSDPVAIVNNQVLTRQQLADEAVAREGKKVLEAMIAGMLIDQAIAARKIVIAPSDVDEETAAIARSMGTTPENWLRTLDKERGISPLQYKRDIVYRIVALRRLAEPRVQVTEEDMKKAYQANYGEKLHYRIIMTTTLQDAKAIWNEVKQNPMSFEKIARDDPRSIDTETKPLGGLGIHPLARHAYPLNLSEAAFSQLVDGNPEDLDPTHKPKDGDLTGPIQISKDAWVIMRREKLDPAQPYDPNNAAERQRFRQVLQEVKLKDMMQSTFNDLLEASNIENRLTGEHKLPKDKVAAAQTDTEVKLMTNPPPPKADAPIRADAAATPRPEAPKGIGPLNIPKPVGAPPRPQVPQADKTKE